jgi:hypothetical protein
VYTAGSIGKWLIDLATSVGSGFIGHIHTGIGAILTTVRDKLRSRIDAALDFGVPTNGVTSATSAIQAMFDEAAVRGVSEIYFPPGTYLITNPRNDTDFTCAIVVSGLRNCTVRGARGTKFIVSAAGAGAAQFGMFRFEQCEGIELCNFEMDGSGIVVTGTGANRSRGLIFVNFDVNSPATDLTVLNKRIHIHDIYIHDIGGALLVARRSTVLVATPPTDNFYFCDNTITDAKGQDGGCGLNYVRVGRVANNRFVNTISANPFDSMTVDASSGCEDVVIENNYGYGYMFGMKCETSTGVGPSGTEIRPSKRVLIQNNYLEEIGDPTLLSFAGSATYGIKVNGKDCIARGNTIKQRTIGVTTGGLTSGIAIFNTHADDSLTVVADNYIKSCQYGIAHADAAPTTRKSTVNMTGNRSDDAVLFGIVVQSNILVENNRMNRSGQSAVDIQSPNDTIVRNNRAYNCGIANSVFIPNRVVFQQEDASVVGLFEFSGNVIIDDRGASAAHYGYFLRGGQIAGNAYIFTPGYTTGLLTAITFDQYFSEIGLSTQLPINTPAPRTITSLNSPAVTAPWSTKAWNVGDRAIRSTPVVGSPKAWSCTVAGTPGTWVSEGVL